MLDTDETHLTPKELQLASARDLAKFESRFTSNFMVYRGLPKWGWALQPSLERSVKNSGLIHNLEYHEQNTIYHFKRRYRNYCAAFPCTEDHVEWLSIMQHYGCPTRLLDFTYSPFVALYFAIAGAYPADGAIWAVNLSAVHEKAEETFRLAHGGETAIGREAVNSLHLKKLNEYIGKWEKGQSSGILIIHPKILSERMARQQGLFLSPTNLYSDYKNDINTFESNFSTIDADDCLFRFRVPHKSKTNLYSELNQMNINAETLFPGLEGMARSIEQLQILGNLPAC